ncbi:MAG: hypothetical protein V1819_01850 [bacterium]
MQTKTILIAILAVLSMVLVGVSAYQRSNQPAEPMPIVINHPVVQNQDETAGWKTYKNEQYGFELKLPSYFGVAELVTPSENRFHLVSVGDKVYNNNTTKALTSIRVKDQRENSTLYVEISIFPIGFYAYAPIADTPTLYDNINKNWYIEYWDDITNQAARREIAVVELKTMEKNGWLGYRFAGGDMGAIAYGIAVPRTNEVVEINYDFSCNMEDCADAECTIKIPEPPACLEDSQLKFEEILNTLKFN